MSRKYEKKEQFLNVREIAYRQFEIDCGISHADISMNSRVDTHVHMNDMSFELPRFVTEEAIAQIYRTKLKEKTGGTPRVYQGTDLTYRGIYAGDRAWILTSPEMEAWCRREYAQGGKDASWFADQYRLRRLDRQLGRLGREVLDVRIGFLPEIETEDPSTTDAIVLLNDSDLLYLKNRAAFPHALCGTEQMPEVLAAAYMINGQIEGIAAATRDCDTMYQIGVDVNRTYRGQGIAVRMVQRLTREVLKMGIVPFYQTGQSHVASMNTALSAGYRPVWTEVYAQRRENDRIRVKS